MIFDFKPITNGRVQILNGSEMIFSNGYDILKYNHRKKEVEKVSKIEGVQLKKIFYKSNIISRGLRLGISQIFKIPDGYLVFIGKNGIFFNNDFSEQKPINLNVKGFQLLDHNICNHPDGILYGEYFPNKKSESVRVYNSNDGLTWDIIFEFKKREIKHIHTLQYDDYSSSIFIGTGDNDLQSKICRLSLDTLDLETIGEGSQKWRTLEFLFSKDKIFWGTDTPLENSSIIEYSRENQIIKKIGKFDGPIYNLKSFSGGFLVITANEGGPGELDNKTHIYYMKSEEIEDIISFKKDIFPYIFGFGRIIVPKGEGDFLAISVHNVKTCRDNLFIGEI